MYKLRLEYSKSDPMNLIAKLLMNSLYGRFGMDTNHNIISCLSDKEYSDLLYKPKNPNDEIINFDEYKYEKYSKVYLY